MTTSQSTVTPLPPIDSGCNEWHHAEIDLRSQPAIELKLRPAGRLAQAECREIEIGETNGLLELVDPIAGQEHPRHMGLSPRHVVSDGRISLRPAKEFDLLIEGRRATGQSCQLVTHRLLHSSAGCRQRAGHSPTDILFIHVGWLNWTLTHINRHDREALLQLLTCQQRTI
jgi:hypothetical protein